MPTRLTQVFPSFDFKDAEIYSQLEKAVTDMRFRYSTSMPYTIVVEGSDSEADPFKIYVIAHWDARQREPKFRAVMQHALHKLRGDSIEAELRHMHFDQNHPEYPLHPIRTGWYSTIDEALIKLNKLLA